MWVIQIWLSKMFFLATGQTNWKKNSGCHVFMPQKADIFDHIEPNL